MSYLSEGKIYTDHALMDEIVYNTKIIVNGLVLKNETEANNNEIKESVEQADYFMAVNDGSMDLSFFPLTIPILEEYGYDNKTAKKILGNRNLIPEEDRESLLSFCNSCFLRDYVEYNNYYRMLNGKPDYKPELYISDEIDTINIKVWDPVKEQWKIEERTVSLNSNGCYGRIYINVKCKDGVYRDKQYYIIDHAIYINKVEIVYKGYSIQVPVIYEKFDNKTFYKYFENEISVEEDDNMNLNFLATLDTCSIYQIVALDSLGVIPKVRELFFEKNTENPKKYKYLNYLGADAIDIYGARKAKNWDILYIPDCDKLVQARFIELYNINREIMEKQTYQLAYQYNSDYYDQMMMVMVVCQTFADMIVDVPEWYIRRDIFDLRSAKYFLESYGVKFFKIIPIKWQTRIVKGLNKLISYKSTEKNIRDILEIFNVPGAEVYNYYIYKNYQYTVIPPDPIDEDPDWDMTEEMEYEDDNWVINCGDAEEQTLPDFDIITASFEFYRRGEGTPEDDENPEIDDAELYHIFEFGYEEGYAPADQIDCGYILNVTPEVEFIDSDGFIHTVYVDDTDPLSPEHPAHRDKVDPVNGYIYAVPDDTLDCGPSDIDDRGVVIPGIVDVVDPDPIDCGNEDGEMIWDGDVTDELLDYEEKIKVIEDEFGDVYKLEFLRVPLGDYYDDYIQDSINRYQYDQITYQDKYWDGQDVHYYVRNNHLRKDFMIEGTKFMGLQYNVDMNELNFQKQYYLGLYFNYALSTDDLAVPVPSIKRNAVFSLQNLFIFLICCNGLMNYTDRGMELLDININTLDNSVEGEPDPFTPYNIVDGGFPWSTKRPDEPIVPPDPEWELEDMDFGNDSTYPDDFFVRDEYTVIYDFGFNYNRVLIEGDICYDYDFGMITMNSLDYDIDIESEEAAYYFGLFPIKDVEDYGDEEFDVPRNEFTLIDGYGNEDSPADPEDHMAIDTEELHNPYIMDYYGGDMDFYEEDPEPETPDDVMDEGTSDPIPEDMIWDPETEEWIYPDPDFDTIYGELDNGVAPNRGENTEANIIAWYEITDTLDVGRLSEIVESIDNVVNTVDELPIEGIEGVAYYVQSADYTTLFQVYEWSDEAGAYLLMGNYGTGEDPTDPYPYDFKVRLDWGNYARYENHYLLLDDGTLLKITYKEMLAPYIGKVKKFRYPWYNLVEDSYFEFDYDGHHLYKDNEYYDLKYVNNIGYQRLDNTDPIRPYHLIREYMQDVLDGGKVIFSIPTKIRLNKESYYDWLKSKYPEIWLDVTNRIYAFNMNVDLDEVEKNISFRHSMFGWTRGYTLADLGCDTFINAKKLKQINGDISNDAIPAKFKDIDQIYYVYTVNRKCYETLIDMIRDSSTRDERALLVYVFEQLFTAPYNRNFYMLKSGEFAETYHDLLKEKDFTLYAAYRELRKENRDELRHDMVRDIMNQIVDTLNYYLRSDNLHYVLSFVKTNSFDAIIQYMWLMIDFFKSWKVQFLNNVVSYQIEDQKMGDTNTPGAGIDTLTEIRKILWTTGNSKIRDAVTITPVYYPMENGDVDPNFEAEVLDLSAHYINDNIFRNRNYNGIHYTINNPLVGETVFSDDGIDVLELDGGIPDNYNNAPRYQENGGRVARRCKPKMLDAGNAIPVDQYREININGGRPGSDRTGPITYDTDRGKKYVIMANGGVVSFRRTQTDTMVVLVDNANCIECSARISEFHDNMIQVLSGYEIIEVLDVFGHYYTAISDDYIEDDEDYEVLDFGEITEDSEREPYDGYTPYDFGLHTKYELVTSSEDGANGLFYDETPYLSQDWLVKFKAEVELFYRNRDKQLDDQWEMIEYLLSGDPYKLVHDIYNELFSTVKYILRLFPFSDYSLLEEEIRNNISTRINGFEQWAYDINPYKSTWQSFSDIIEEGSA